MWPTRHEFLPQSRNRKARRALACLAAAAALAAGAVPSTALAEDAPTGGGTGCQSNGNCQGTLYTDKSNLDRWWYRRCSGCHTATVAEPVTLVKEPTSDLRLVFSDPPGFWRLHGQAQTDPVLKRLLPQAKLKPVRTIAPEYQTLMQRR